VLKNNLSSNYRIVEDNNSSFSIILTRFSLLSDYLFFAEEVFLNKNPERFSFPGFVFLKRTIFD